MRSPGLEPLYNTVVLILWRYRVLAAAGPFRNVRLPVSGITMHATVHITGCGPNNTVRTQVRVKWPWANNYIKLVSYFDLII